MIGYNQIAKLVKQLRDELDLNHTQDTDNNPDLKLAVARVLSSNMLELELKAMGIHPDQDEYLYDDDWVSIWATLIIGQKYPTKFREALAKGKVLLLSEYGDMPDGFGKLEIPCVAEPVGPGYLYIVGDGEELPEGLEAVDPHRLALSLVAETNPGPDQVFALLRLLGFTTPDKDKDEERHGKVWTYKMGYDQYLELKISSKGLWFNGKRLKPWIFLAGDLVANPTDGEVPWKALFWIIQYALAGSNAQKMKLRLKHLTEALVDNSEGAVTEGAARVKLENTLGMLGVYATWNGCVNVCNAATAIVEGYASSSPLLDALSVLNRRGIPWALQSMGKKVYVGPGAQVLGQSTYLKQVDDKTKRVLRFVMRIDKLTKVFARTANLFVKATCRGRIVEILDESNPYV